MECFIHTLYCWLYRWIMNGLWILILHFLLVIVIFQHIILIVIYHRISESEWKLKDERQNVGQAQPPTSSSIENKVLPFIRSYFPVNISYLTVNSSYASTNLVLICELVIYVVNTRKMTLRVRFLLGMSQGLC